MAKLTIFVGKEKPLTARGENQVRLLGFAERYRGIHSFATDRVTRQAIRGLEKRGSIRVHWDSNQFECA